MDQTVFPASRHPLTVGAGVLTDGVVFADPDTVILIVSGALGAENKPPVLKVFRILWNSFTIRY